MIQTGDGCWGIVLAAIMLGSFSSAARADVEPLPMNTMTPGATPLNEDRGYRFTAASPGLLTISANAPDGENLYFYVCDDEGQLVRYGYFDTDRDGKPGSEYGWVRLNEAGAYTVYVGSDAGHRVAFEVAGTWLADPAVALARDDNAKPSGAVAIEVGRSIGGKIRPKRGNFRNWYVVTAPADGRLAAFTAGRTGDLTLDAFRTRSYVYAVATSDMDVDDNAGNEGLVIEAAAGEKVYFRVEGYDEDQASDYIFSVHLIQKQGEHGQ